MSKTQMDAKIISVANKCGDIYDHPAHIRLCKHFFKKVETRLKSFIVLPCTLYSVIRIKWRKKLFAWTSYKSRQKLLSKVAKKTVSTDIDVYL